MVDYAEGMAALNRIPYSPVDLVKRIINYRWLGLIVTVFWSTLLYVIGVGFTVSTVDEDFLYPLKYVIHPQTGGYLLATATYGLILFSLYCFNFLEYKNRPGHWRKHRLVEEAVDKNKLSNADDYSTTLSPEEMTTKKLMLLCPVCKLETTSRGHHCAVCNICVLRRDHHCFIYGSCVGMGNQRFFINTSFWCLFGCLLFVGFQGHYHVKYAYSIVEKLLATSSIYADAVNHVLKQGWEFPGSKAVPVMGAALYMGGDRDYIINTLILILTIAAAILCMIFLGGQVYLVRSGYTLYENSNDKAWKRLNPDGQTMADRYRLVFGKHWLLNMIFPNIWDDPEINEDIATNLFRPQLRPKLKEA